MRLLLSTLALVVALAGPGSAAATSTRGPSIQTPAARVAPRLALSDAQIERNIRAKLAKSKISTNHFTVKVSGGVALLEGRTAVIQHKGVATRLAKSGGAIAVQNQIQISEEARAKAAARLAKYRGTAQLARATVVQAAVKPK